jgi:hypothetical protein
MQHECDMKPSNKTARQKSSAAICEAGASSSSAARANISARSKHRIARGAEAVAIKQFALDDQRGRLLIRERP